MKYESTILKRLIDTYGVVGNPRYISEIIKEFIVRGKECFPNLFTYQADWLAHIDEFGLNPTYTVSYTGQSIYAPNTLERPVKSAILKGSTKYRDISSNKIYDSYESATQVWSTNKYKLWCAQDGGATSELNGTITSGTDIVTLDLHAINHSTYKLTGNCTYKKVAFYDNNQTFISSTRTAETTDDLVVNNIPSNARYVRFAFFPYADNTGSCSIVDESNNPINLRQIQLISCKTPVLTTSNEDGTKSNILTVNEDVTLRGIGNVKDELDCLTGEVTQYINEIVLNGSENWVDRNTETETHKTYYLRDLSVKANTPFICDKLANSYTIDTNGIFSNGWDGHYFFIRLDKTIVTNVSELKAYLQSNPITVQYQLETESVKTVDLTIHDKDHQKVERLTSFEGGTHFTTSSQDGSLLPTLTVDVVTDLEETLAVCSLEGNTM